MDEAKRKILSSAFFEHGKVPPQAVDLEEVVLGALMLESATTPAAIELLEPRMFYKESHQIIFEAIVSLFGRGDAVDILTVVNECKSKGDLERVGGAYSITELTSKVSSTQNIETHIAIVETKFRARELIRVSSEGVQKGFEDTTDVDEVINNSAQKLLDLANSKFEKRTISTEVLAKNVKEEIYKIRSGEIEDNRVNTGFYKLDGLMNGWRAGDLIIIAGRPGMGKTALMISLVYNISIVQQIPMAVFSLEMTSRQIVIRVSSVLSGVQFKTIEGASFTDAEGLSIDASFSEIEKAPIYIDDTPGLSLVDLRSKVLQLISKYGIKMIIVDYLQLMTTDDRKDGRERQIANISAGLKNMAKTSSIPVIALSQLNRDCENRKPPVPKLSDLRESGTLEQDADAVLFLYRDEYYGYEVFVNLNGYEETGTEDKARIIVAKHRNGKTGTAVVDFTKRLMKFENAPSQTSQTSQPSLPVPDEKLPF